MPRGPGLGAAMTPNGSRDPAVHRRRTRRAAGLRREAEGPRTPFSRVEEERYYLDAAEPAFYVSRAGVTSFDPVLSAFSPHARRDPIAQTDVRQSLWILVAGVFFALMGAVVKLAAAEFSAAELVFYRSLLQTVIAGCVLFRLGVSPKTSQLGLHLRRAVFGVLSLFMFFYALTVLPIATAVALNYTSPIFLVLIVACTADRRPGWGVVATVAVGSVGAFLVLRPSVDAQEVWPAAIALGSGALNAMAFWSVRELVRASEPEGRVVFYFSIFGCLGALIWMAPQTWQPITLANVWMLAAVGLSGAAGQLAMTRAFGKGKTLVTAALSYSGIVVASVLGVALFAELLPLLAWVGIALIVTAGILAVQAQSPARARGAA